MNEQQVEKFVENVKRKKENIKKIASKYSDIIRQKVEQIEADVSEEMKKELIDLLNFDDKEVDEIAHSASELFVNNSITVFSLMNDPSENCDDIAKGLMKENNIDDLAEFIEREVDFFLR